MDEFARAMALAELGKSDDLDDEDDDSDAGLNHPADYVVMTWQEHRLHHNYPEPGGYNNQDFSLMEDWGYLNARFNRWFAKLRNMDDDDDDMRFDEPEGEVRGLEEL